jgi:hypothetical protein
MQIYTCFVLLWVFLCNHVRIHVTRNDPNELWKYLIHWLAIALGALLNSPTIIALNKEKSLNAYLNTMLEYNL